MFLAFVLHGVVDQGADQFGQIVHALLGNLVQ